MRNKVVIKNTTSSGIQTINIEFFSVLIKDALACVEIEKTRRLCKEGCVNYGRKWSCPPFSSRFSDIVSDGKFDKGIIIVGNICLDDMKYIKNPYQQVKAANMILKSRCERMARYIESRTDGYSLLSGSCNLCKPCKKKKGIFCKHPEKMRYSLESTGLNVQSLLEDNCGYKLLWYEKGMKLQYTSVVTMVLINSAIVSDRDVERVMDEMKKELINLD